MSRSQRASGYHRLSIASKQRLEIERMREPPVVCGDCGITTMPSDLVEHTRTRCPGKQDPTAHAQWITWQEARKLGAPKASMSRWVALGIVRVRGEVQDRRYLLRDVADRVSAALRRRKFRDRNRPGLFRR